MIWLLAIWFSQLPPCVGDDIPARCCRRASVLASVTTTTGSTYTLDPWFVQDFARQCQ